MNNKQKTKTGARYTIRFRRVSDDKQAVLYVSRDWRDHTVLCANNVQNNIKLIPEIPSMVLCIIRIIVTLSFCFVSLVHK